MQRSLKLLMGFLLWLLKSLCAVIQDAATEIKASCTCIIREKCCPEHGGELDVAEAAKEQRAGELSQVRAVLGLSPSMCSFQGLPLFR